MARLLSQIAVSARPGFRRRRAQHFARASLCALLLTVYCCVFAACGVATQQRTFFGPLEKTARFAVDTSVATDRQKLSAYVINQDGLRIGGSPNVSLDLAAGVVNVSLGNQTLIPLDNVSPAEKLASLGEGVPQRVFTGWFADEPVYSISLELVLSAVGDLLNPVKLDASTKGFLAKYSRFHIPISRSDLLSPSPVVQPLGTEVPLAPTSSVAFVPFYLKSQPVAPGSGEANLDTKNAPFQLDSSKDVKIMALSLGLNEKTSKPIWFESAYLPVFVKPTKSATGFAGPIYYNAQTPLFQLFAKANKDCVTATVPTKFDGQNPMSAMQVDDTLCADKTFSASLKKSLWVKPQATYRTQSQVVANEKRTINLTNKNSFAFFVAGNANKIRKLDIFIDLVNESTGAKVRQADLFSVDYFASYLEVKLNPGFGGGAFRSTFAISIGSTGKEFDETKTEFWFLRSKALPQFAVAGDTPDTKVLSAGGVEGRITAGDAAKFVIQSSRCGENRFFGVVAGVFAGSSNTKFYPCKNGTVEIPYSAINNTSSVSPITLRLFLKDEFDNISQEDEKTTQLDVEVDDL